MVGTAMMRHFATPMGARYLPQRQQASSSATRRSGGSPVVAVPKTTRPLWGTQSLAWASPLRSVIKTAAVNNYGVDQARPTTPLKHFALNTLSRSARAVQVDNSLTSR